MGSRPFEALVRALPNLAVAKQVGATKPRAGHTTGARYRRPTRSLARRLNAGQLPRSQTPTDLIAFRNLDGQVGLTLTPIMQTVRVWLADCREILHGAFEQGTPFGRRHSFNGFPLRTAAPEQATRRCERDRHDRGNSEDAVPLRRQDLFGVNRGPRNQDKSGTHDQSPSSAADKEASDNGPRCPGFRNREEARSAWNGRMPPSPATPLQGCIPAS